MTSWKPISVPRCVVLGDAQVIQVEREREVLFGHHDRRSRPQGVTDAELVKGVGIRRREVGDDEIGLEQIFIHRLVDQFRVDDFVSADAFETRLRDRRLDDVFERPVQVEDPLRIRLEVRFLAKPHDDETGLLAGSVRHRASPPTIALEVGAVYPR